MYDIYQLGTLKCTTGKVLQKTLVPETRNQAMKR